MSEKFLNNEDVISMEASSRLVGSKTFKVTEAWDSMISSSPNLEPWIEGIECRVLKSNVPGWQKGALYVRLEFVPDPPDVVCEDDDRPTNPALY